MLSTMMLRSLMKARYSEENLGYWPCGGLLLPFHFPHKTLSRPYGPPDNKEWLSNRLDDERIAYYSRVTEDAARQSSETEVQAIEAEREWVSYKMRVYGG